MGDEKIFYINVITIKNKLIKNVHPSNIHVANSSIFFVRHVFDGHCLSLGNIYIKYANEIKKGSVS